MPGITRWIRLDADICAHLSDLTSVEFHAYIAAMTAATWQPTPGRFATVGILNAHLEAARRGLARTVPRLMNTHRLVRRRDGSVEVKDWTEWQRPRTAAERQADFRARASRDPSRAALLGTVTPRGEEEKKGHSRYETVTPPMDPDDIPPSSKVVRTAGGWTAVGDVPVALAARPSVREQVQRDEDPDADPE